MSTISIEVVPYGPDQGAYRAGQAIVRLNGEVVAKLRTTEGIEFVIAEPEISTRRAIESCSLPRYGG